MSEGKKQHDLARTHERLMVVHLEASQRDAQKFMNDGQYLHMVDVADEVLPNFGNPTITYTVTINKVEGNLWTFDEMYGPLGNIHARAFFGLFSSRHEVVVAGYEQVHDDRNPRRYVILKMQNRLTYYATTFTYSGD